GDTHQALRMMLDAGGHLVVAHQRPLRSPPGTEHPDPDACLIHRRERRLERRCGVERASARPAAERLEHRMGDELRRGVLHPGVDDPSGAPHAHLLVVDTASGSGRASSPTTRAPQRRFLTMRTLRTIGAVGLCLTWSAPARAAILC